jgi:tetratricopeptide (TPR) repeat protein
MTPSIETDMKTAKTEYVEIPEPAAQNVPFHVHLARIREIERAQKAQTATKTPVSQSRPTPRATAAMNRMRLGQERFVSLRKKAVELETAKQFEAALAVYMELVNSLEDCPEDLEIALLNRVGDLMTRVGKAGPASDFYEMAADKYTARGLTDNAIAIFNKILRASPERTTIYQKLGRLCAKKGLRTDAKRNFVEYSTRLKQQRNYEEAFRALSEFVDAFPDQDDVRLSLIDQLDKAGYHHETVKQLESLLAYYRSVGRLDDAQQAAARLEACVPRFAG